MNLAKNAHDIWDHRQLLYFLTLKDITVRYKQAFFGISWAILIPTVHAILFALIFGVFLKISNNPREYFLMVFTGFIFWNFFSQSVSTSIASLTGNYNLVTKTTFPKDILILSSITGRFPDLMAGFLVLLIVLIFFQVSISPLIFLLIPLVFLEIILTASVGLFLSSINVYYRDVTALIPLFLTVWLYLSPIVYSIDKIPDSYRFIFYLNPMTAILEGIRNILIFHKSPDLLQLSVSSVVIFVLFYSSYLVFKKLEKGFADII